jgi:hypothetical protein
MKLENYCVMNAIERRMEDSMIDLYEGSVNFLKERKAINDCSFF